LYAGKGTVVGGVTKAGRYYEVRKGKKRYSSKTGETSWLLGTYTTVYSLQHTTHLSHHTVTSGAEWDAYFLGLDEAAVSPIVAKAIAVLQAQSKEEEEEDEEDEEQEDEADEEADEDVAPAVDPEEAAPAVDPAPAIVTSRTTRSVPVTFIHSPSEATRSHMRK
jgi:hypothetical protein